MPSSRASSQPKGQIQVSCIVGRFFTIWATGGAQERRCFTTKKKKKIDKIQRNTVMQEIRDNHIFVFFKLCRKQTEKWQKVEDKTLEEITEVELGNLLDREFKVMVVNMFKELGGRLDEQSEKLGGFNKVKGFPCNSVGKESTCNTGDPGSIPGSGRSPWEGNGNSSQYSCLENAMGRGAWWTPSMGHKESDMTEMT